MNTAYYTEKSRRFAIYPDAGTGNTTEYMYLALGLSDEAGEVAGKIKKCTETVRLTLKESQRNLVT